MKKLTFMEKSYWKDRIILYCDKQWREVRFGFFISWFDGFQFHIDLGLVFAGVIIRRSDPIRSFLTEPIDE